MTFYVVRSYEDEIFFRDFDNALWKAVEILHENYMYSGGTKEEFYEDIKNLKANKSVDGIVNICECGFMD